MRQPKIALVLVLMMAAVAFGCATNRGRMKVAAKVFSEQHTCPQDQVTVTETGKLGYYDVSGCDKVIRYICRYVPLFYTRCEELPPQAGPVSPPLDNEVDGPDEPPATESPVEDPASSETATTATATHRIH